MPRRRALNERNSSKEKGDSSNKDQVRPDKPVAFNPIRAVFEEAEAKSSQDKPQQSDVGSSSDSSGVVNVPEDFRYIGGNTELAKAKIIFLGDGQTPQHSQDIVDFITTRARKDEIVLVEGVQANEEIGKVKYAIQQGVARGYNYRIFDRDVKIYGCGNDEAGSEIREKTMLETIREMRSKFPDKRLFIIALEDHFTVPTIQEKLKDQPYIALSPRHDAAKEDIPRQALASSSRREATEELERAGTDRVQQGDAGSSSDEIPADFQRIGGNTKLGEAQVILLGEAHILQHSRNIVDFINTTYAKKGGIVLVEGVEANEQIDNRACARALAKSVGGISKDLRLKNNFVIWGWDNMKVHEAQSRALESHKKCLNEDRIDFEMAEKWQKIICGLLEKREGKMLETINNVRDKFPNTRLFIITGYDHITETLMQAIKNQPYIALRPRYKPSQKEMEDGSIVSLNV